MMQSLPNDSTPSPLRFHRWRERPAALYKEESQNDQKSLWLKFSKHPLVMPYNRLAILVMAVNSAIFGALAEVNFKIGGISDIRLLDLTIANFAIALLIRQQYVINLLFFLATSAPLRWPLKVRWALAKVYHFGGIHVGAFFSGFVWYSMYAINLFTLPQKAEWMLHLLVPIHLTILAIMMVAAVPVVRAKYHNEFEIVSRFGGWASLLLFWVQTIVILQTTNPKSLLMAMTQSGHVAILVLLTVNAALPWFRLKKVPVRLTKASNHAVFADFDYGVTPFSGSSTELSRNPIFEWHSFANIPIPHRTGFKLTISRAGDWTGRLIDDLPSYVWVKGIPRAGVGNIEKLFRKVVWVATGSGIGPCLPHLLANEVPSTLVWSTRNPRTTYGDDVVEDILRVQPEALIWDTDQDGKPDLVALAYETYKRSGAEAVICIANKKVTWNVVYEMESRGIPAFGAIWDS